MKKSKIIGLCFCLFMFGVMALLVTNNWVTRFDSGVYKIITFHMSDLETSIFKIITFFASEYGVLLITLLCFIFIKDKRYCFYIFLSAVIIVLLNYGLKTIFMRQRPVDLMIIEESGYSFPSGHAMLSLGFYGFIIYVIRRLDINSNLKNVLTILLCFLIVLIGSSRIYLGVHYPSDILAGYFVSSAFLILYTEVIGRIMKNG